MAGTWCRVGQCVWQESEAGGDVTDLARGVDLRRVPLGLVLQIDLVTGEGSLGLRESNLCLVRPREVPLATSCGAEMGIVLTL